MKEIALTRGKVAIVDDEDYEYLSRYKWSCYKAGWRTKKYYAMRSGGGRSVSMHREILGLSFGDKKEGDHITLDN